MIKYCSALYMCYYSLYYMIITIKITLFTAQVTDKTNTYINS